MKKRVFLALLAAAAVTFVGCSKDDDGPDEGPQTYTITFEGDDWSPLVVANYNGGKAMSVVYEDKAYTWTDQTTQLTSPCPEGWRRFTKTLPANMPRRDLRSDRAVGDSTRQETVRPPHDGR